MNSNNETHQQIKRLLDIDMHYQPGRNNHETGIERREMTLKICARFNIVGPVIIRWLYGIPHRLALQHLNKLVDEELLMLVKTHRSVDGRVYVLQHSGAKYAEELLGLSVPFRKASEPSRQINQNNVAHDLMNAFICLRGIHEYNNDGNHTPLWDGIVTEVEFKRIYKASAIRNVDGLVRECGNEAKIIALEIEHSFKTKEARKVIICKYLNSIKQGHYQKVFMFSQSQRIFKDIKRLHDQLLDEMTTHYDKKTRLPLMTKNDADLLKHALVYRTKFCDELQSLFYP